MRKITSYPLVYRGSVKNLRALKKPVSNRQGIYLFEYTDDYSIFDYGKMPDSLQNKGAAVAIMTAYLFEQLEAPSTWRKLARSGVWESFKDKKFAEQILTSPVFRKLKKQGLATHYRGLRDQDGKLVHTHKLRRPTNIMEVKAVNILRPEKCSVEGLPVWHYGSFHPGRNNFLVPLELVFRFGLPRGSSLLERLSMPDYHLSLGLRTKPREGSWLSRPVLEYFTKLEPGDRHLMPESALNFSGLDIERFVTMQTSTYLIAVFLLDFFKRADIRLWDGKFEFLRSGEIMLGDAITPDELRLTKQSIQISKEPIRQYYKKNQKKFSQSFKKAKVMAAATNREISDIVNNTLRTPPLPMDPAFRSAVEDMYVAITAETTGIDVFDRTPPLNSVVKTLKQFI